MIKKFSIKKECEVDMRNYFSDFSFVPQHYNYTTKKIQKTDLTFSK